MSGIGHDQRSDVSTSHYWLTSFWTAGRGIAPSEFSVHMTLARSVPRKSTIRMESTVRRTVHCRRPIPADEEPARGAVRTSGRCRRQLCARHRRRRRLGRPPAVSCRPRTGVTRVARTSAAGVRLGSRALPARLRRCASSRAIATPARRRLRRLDRDRHGGVRLREPRVRTHRRPSRHDAGSGEAWCARRDHPLHARRQLARPAGGRVHGPRGVPRRVRRVRCRSGRGGRPTIPARSNSARRG